MRRSTSTLLALICAAALGCGAQTASENHSKTNAASDTKTAASHGDATAPSGTAAATPASMTGDMTVTGTTGCGHCTFHTTESCAFCVQSAEGKIYVVDNIQEGDKMWGARFEGKKVRIKGAVTEKDGKAHLQMASLEEVQ